MSSYSSARLLSAVCLALSALSQSVSAQTLTIVNATVIDVAAGSFQSGMTVVIEGNRIASVGPTANALSSQGRVVDAKGLFMIPGLWDMHTHAYFGGPTNVGDQLTLPLFIANGVTGIRDMGSDLDPVLRARREVNAHRMIGPRMVVSGPMLDGPVAQYKSAIAIKTPEDGRKAVDMLKQRGVDFIKIQSGVPHEAYIAIADEAKRLVIPFEGHVPDAVRAVDAIAAGQRTFEHLIGIFEASTPNEKKYLLRRYGAGKDTTADKRPGMFLDAYDPVREASIVRLLAQKKLWQCPTLYWERGQWLVDDIDFTKDPDLAYAAQSWVAQWPASRKSILESLDTDSLPLRRRFVTHELEVVRKLRAAGVPFLAGTDTPAGVDVIPGISLHLELQRFVAAGFTTLDALRTATINPAKFYNRENELGAIQAGYLADIVLLRANPLIDISNTRTIAGVVADGRYFSERDISQLNGRLRELAKKR
ncbi:MAG: amidohydrolase family protein [Gemmatimonadaceae bacterium]